MGFSLLFPQYAIQYPSPPVTPEVKESTSGSSINKEISGKKDKSASKTPQAQMRIRIHLGDKSILVAEAPMNATYSFSHQKGRLTYQRTIRAEDIRELAIEAYRARKVSSSKEGDTYEFEPSQVRIELKDGQSFTLSYLFKDLRKIHAKNADGAFTVFGFFADTYNPKSGWQERGGITMPRVTRQARPAAFTKLEYFEAVDKTGGSE
ncbi:MAG TPA: hypothetical protein PLY93_11435 [Turneriella sp.]|nr:hypothetical protein [Turneriella sp.]